MALAGYARPLDHGPPTHFIVVQVHQTPGLLVARALQPVRSVPVHSTAAALLHALLRLDWRVQLIHIHVVEQTRVHQLPVDFLLIRRIKIEPVRNIHTVTCFTPGTHLKFLHFVLLKVQLGAEDLFGDFLLQLQQVLGGGRHRGCLCSGGGGGRHVQSSCGRYRCGCVVLHASVEATCSTLLLLLPDVDEGLREPAQWKGCDKNVGGLLGAWW